jgi:hypothetical protein
MRGAVLVLLLCVLAPAATANAGTLRMGTYNECNGDVACSKYMGGTTEVMLDFKAAPGERNALVVEPAGDRIRVADAVATIDPEPVCEHVSPHEALCPFPRSTTVDLGDQDDTLTITAGAKTTIFGGPGADTITGGRFAEEIDGGPGRDLLTYARRTEHVVVDLLRRDRPYLDVFQNVEDAIGGSGNDTLIGTDGPETLDGGPGDDRIIGNAGNDHLVAGDGRDVVSGGAGADALAVADGQPDTVVCGAGSDGVLQLLQDLDYYSEDYWRGADAGDRLARDCERVALNGELNEVDIFTIDPRVHVTAGRAWVRNPCATIEERPCSGTIRVGRTHRRFRAGAQRIVLPQRRLPARIRIVAAVRAHGILHPGAWTADRTIVG